MLDKLKSFKWGYVLFAVLFIAVGILFIAFSQSLSYLAITLGIILLVFGIVYAVLSIAERERGVFFFLRMVFAVTAIICAIITLVMRENAVETISSVMALLLIIDASFKLHTAAMSKRYMLFGWWFMIIVSVLTIIGAFVTVKYLKPVDPALSIVLGITLIIDGIGNFFSAFFVPIYEKSMRESIYYSMCNSQDADLFAVPQPTSAGETEEDGENE